MRPLSAMLKMRAGRRWSGRRGAAGVSRPAFTWFSITGSRVCTPGMPGGALRIGPRLLLAGVRGVVGADARRRRRRATPRQSPSRCVRVADRRVHLGEGAEPLVALGRGQGQVLAAAPRPWRRPCARQDLDLVGGGDVQHVDALARRRARRTRRSRRPDRRLLVAPLRMDGRIGAVRDQRPRSARRYSSSEWKATRRLTWRSTASDASSSATSSVPVEEPMNTLTPQQPGRRSSSPKVRRRSRGCAPT